MSTPKCKKRLLDGPSPSPKRARTDITLQKKMDLIKEAEALPKPTQKELSAKFGIDKTTVSDFLKRKEFYIQQFEENFGSSKKRFVSNRKYGELNELTYQWFS